MNLKSTQKKNLMDYLIDALNQKGCKEIFGIPGDFALDFFEVIEKSRKLKIYSLSHEPALAFAADGFSRVKNRISSVGLTFGAGGFNALNSVACAYAERSPLVILSGAPGVNERNQGLLLHHQTKSLASQRKVFQEVTAYATCLDDPLTASLEIQKALDICTEKSRPVYIEIPRDQVHSKIPISPWKKFKPQHDFSSCQEAILEIKKLLQKSKRPTLMIGLEVHRYKLQKEIIDLAEHLKLPVVTSFMARCTFPVGHPLYRGVYLGEAGDNHIKNLVEKSDCLIMLGVMMTDTNMGISLKNLNPKSVINACDQNLMIGYHQFQNINLRSLIKEMNDNLKASSKKQIRSKHKKSSLKKNTSKRPLKVKEIIESINYYFQEKGPLPLVADTGDSVFASIDIKNKITVASGYYASMGFAVPAGIGMQLALNKRVMILCGDGAFHMTGNELANCQKFNINPIVVIINNKNWEMLQVIKPEAKYFQVPNWNFQQVAEAWGGKGFCVKTLADLHHALESAFSEKTFCIIDAQVPPGERSRTLEKYLKKVKK